MYEAAFRNIDDTLWKDAGCSGRRTFITQLSERGVSVRVIQALARHSSLSTTQRYIDVSVDKLRTAVDGLVMIN